MAKRVKNMLLIALASAALLITVMFLFCHKEYYACVDYVSVPQELKLNEPFCYWKYPQTQLTVLEVNKADGKCLFEVRDLEGGEFLTRWVKEGGQIWGNQGATLQAIDEDTATVVFRWGDVEYHWRFGLKNHP